MTRVGQAPSLRAGLLLGLVLSSGCSPDSQEALPRGTALLGEARSFARLLAAAETLRGTPVAVAAGAARRRLESCEEFEAFCAPGEDCRLLERLECGSGRPELAEARRALEGSDWLLSRFYGPDERWVLRGRLEGDGSVSARLELSLPAELGAFSLLLPGEAARGPSTLSHRRALTHARVRPEDGLNVAALVPGEGWGAAIFRLQSELFVFKEC